MRAKLLAGAAALALTTATVLASAAPASAAPWGWRHGWGWHGGWGWGGAVAGGIIGGALAAATSPLWAPDYYNYYPGYAYAPPVTAYNYVAPGGNVAWCEAQYRSYNPATGMFLGYDGRYHPCP